MIHSDVRSLFLDMVSRPDGAVDLAEASLLIACEEYPELQPARYIARLDELAGAVRRRIETSDPRAAARALRGLLCEQEGFKGNREEYYDPRNSFLNEVLDRRTGIPITLSMVYMEVGRRAGLDVHGVGLPGHFIIRISTPEGDVLVDPFHEGAVVSEADCQGRLDRIYGGRVKVEPHMLVPCERKGILARMLRNLKAIYLKAEDHGRALRTVELLVRLDPRAVEEIRDRGLLHAELDCYSRAAADFEAYLEKAPGAPEAAELRQKIAEMRRKASRLN